MPSKVRFLFVTLALAALVPACASESDAPADDEPAVDDIKAREVVKVGGASGQTVAVKKGQDILLTLAGPSPTPFTGWRIVSASGDLGKADERWIQGQGAVNESGSSTFRWHTAKATAGSHKVVVEIDRGRGDGTQRFDFTADIK